MLMYLTFHLILVVLTKGEKGVHAKFVGTPIVGPKKKAIWVPKSLVTNVQDRKSVV